MLINVTQFGKDKSVEEKRLRMFAGPNGSGKSTVYRSLKEKFNIGTYINADDLEQRIVQNEPIELAYFGINPDLTPEEFNQFIKNHSLYLKATKTGYKIDLILENGKILNPISKTHSYEASILADFIRTKLIDAGKKLTFETVMSHPSKIETLKRSYELGYKNYLYFISTESPEINKNRVINRVQSGGHPVPEDKIVSRYFSSLNYLVSAIPFTYRTFIFDNSGEVANLILDIRKGNEISFHHDIIPAWVSKYVIESS